MVDRLLKLSVLPICVSMLVGVVLIGPQLRQGDDGVSEEQADPSAPEISGLASRNREPERLQPYPPLSEAGVAHSDPTHIEGSAYNVAGGGDSDSVESIDLTGILNDSWDEPESEQDRHEGFAVDEAGLRGGFADDRESIDHFPTAGDQPSTESSNAWGSDTNDLALNSPGQQPTYPERTDLQSQPYQPGLRDPRMSQGQSLREGLTPPSPSYQDNMQVVEPFPQSGTLYNDPMQSSIAPPNRASGSIMNAPQYDAPPQNAEMRLPQHVVERLQQTLEGAAILARKGALFSARNEFIHTLYLIAEARDSMLGTRAATKHLEAALTAMRESDDFSRNHQSHDYHLDIARIVGRHDTPVLDAEVGNPITPLEAMRRYYEFAGNNLMLAFGNEPVAASALHSLGKLHIMPSGLAENGEAYAVPKAVVFFQSAVTINPADSKSANELGVQLARLGEWGGAKQAFLQSVAAQPSVVAWQNLAVVHQHLNEMQLAKLAENEAGILQQQQQQFATPQVSTAAGPVEFITPTDFASQSPMNTPYGVNPSYVGDTGRSRAPEAQDRTARQPESRRTIWDWF